MFYCFGVLALPCRAPAVLLAEPGDACMGATKLQARAEHWGSAGCADSPGIMLGAAVTPNTYGVGGVGVLSRAFSKGSLKHLGQDPAGRRGTLTWIVEPTSRWIFGRRDIDVT